MMMSHHHSQCQWSNELWILTKISISSDIELIKKELYDCIDVQKCILSKSIEDYIKSAVGGGI